MTGTPFSRYYDTAMNTYYLNDTPLAEFGFVPGHASGSNIALSGAWDMPARTGETYRKWAGEDGVEPYVRPDDDYLFGSREIQLVGNLVADSEETLYEKIETFRAFLTGLPADAFLRCDWGQWNVSLRKEVKIVPRKTIAAVTLAFTEPAPALPDFSDATGPWPRQWILASGHWNSFGVWDDREPWYCAPRIGAIDEWLWESFGLAIASTGGVWDLPARDELPATLLSPGASWAPGGLGPHVLNLEGALSAADMEDFDRKIRSLTLLFGRPGLRKFRYRNCEYGIFAPEGFKIASIQKRSRVYAKFTVKLIEAYE